MSALAVLALAGVASYGLRASFIAGAGSVTMPARVEAGLRYARPAVIAALVATTLARHAEGTPLPLRPEEVIGVVAAGLVAWRTRNLVWTMVAGLGALLASEAAWRLVGQ